MVGVQPEDDVRFAIHAEEVEEREVLLHLLVIESHLDCALVNHLEEGVADGLRAVTGDQFQCLRIGENTNRVLKNCFL